MIWKNLVGAVINRALDYTVVVCSYGGALVAAAGSAGFTIARGMDKPVDISYAAAGVAAGDLKVSARLEGMDFAANVTLPIHASGDADGQQNKNVANWADPSFVQMVSAIAIVSGTVIKLLGDQLRIVQRYRADRARLVTDEEVPLAKPPLQVTLSVYAESLATSLSLAMLGNMAATCVIYYSNLLGSDVDLTYPASGPSYMNSTLYDGPAISRIYPLVINFDPTEALLKLPFIGEVKILLDMAVHGFANVTYGAGVTFQQSSPPIIPPGAAVAITSAIAVLSFEAHRFFSERVVVDRDERIASLKRRNKRALIVNSEEGDALLQCGSVSP